MAIVYLLLGSNLGNREDNLSKAIETIDKTIGKVSKKSKLYETKPWGVENQPKFLNQAVEVTTKHNPKKTLEKAKEIESQLGRDDMDRWAPRPIDIDIIFYDDEMISEIDLSIPHPFFHERKFALIPMSEIAPEKYHPLMGMTVIEVLMECNDESEVIEHRVSSKS